MNDTLYWEPQPDITAFETAQALPLMISAAVPGPWFDVKAKLDKLPPEVRRHFRIGE